MTTLVIDCPYLAHRAIHTMGALTYETEHTGVIFGFLMQVLSYAKEFKTNDIIFCWDSKKSERKKIYPPYKEKRKQTDEESSEEEKRLKENGYKQFEVLRKNVLPDMGFKNILFQEGYEADDLIATTVMYHEKDFLVITADQDMYQLLDFCNMWDPKTKKEYSYDDFLKEWNLVPEQWISVKSYAGCSSDNIEGLQGVGEKTAAKFLRGQLKPGSKKHTLLQNSSTILERNKKLVELPFSGTKVHAIQKNELDFDKFIQAVCYRYSFDSFLGNNYYLKWENFFKGDF